MEPEPIEKPHPAPDEPPPGGHSWTVLFLGALVTGLLVGLIGTTFLLLLRWGDQLRGRFIELAGHWPAGLGWFAVCAVVMGATVAATWLVQRICTAAGGSGIPRVESILRGKLISPDTWIIPVKIVGGWLALSAGLALGREGPTVQIGAVIGERLGRRLRGIKDAWMFLMSAGAGAGLATAFNAPVGGTMFVLEEVLRRMTPLGFILTATASTAAIWVQRGLFGLSRDYVVAPVPNAPVSSIWLFVAMGLAIGCVGVGYNRLLLGLLDWLERLPKLPVLWRAALIGLVVGTVAWFAPSCVSGGDDITQSLLLGGWGARMLLAVAAIRFLLGPLSYAAGTPGGLFAPVMVLGAILGTAAGVIFHRITPELAPGLLAFTLVGMTAFFTATIRAPLTGIVICMEMTGSYVMFFPMLAACLAAYLVAEILHDVPIYDALGRRPLAQDKTAPVAAPH